MNIRKYIQEINQEGYRTNMLGAEVPVALSTLGAPRVAVVTEEWLPAPGLPDWHTVKRNMGGQWICVDVRGFYTRAEAEANL